MLLTIVLMYLRTLLVRLAPHLLRASRCARPLIAQLPDYHWQTKEMLSGGKAEVEGTRTTPVLFPSKRLDDPITSVCWA